MKKIAVLLILVLSLCLLTACDPVLPVDPATGEVSILTVTCQPETLSVGQTATLVLTLPGSENTAMDGWRNIRTTVVEGADVVTADGPNLTAHRPGTARVQVEADACFTMMGMLIATQPYQTEVEITVNG